MKHLVTMLLIGLMVLPVMAVAQAEDDWEPGMCRGSGYGQGFGNGQGRHSGQGMGFGLRAIESMAKELDITDEQMAQILEVQEGMEVKAIHNRSAMRKLRMQMRNAMQQDNPDRSAIHKLIEEIGTLETTIHKNRVDTFLNISAILTPQQREALEDAREDRRDSRREARTERRQNRRSRRSFATED